MQGEAATVAALFAVDPVGLGGVAVRAPAGASRADWLDLLRGLLPAGTPLRRVPLNTSDTALLGGLDLGATLQSGRPVVLQGLLAQADGGVLLLAMAERMGAAAATRFCAALDTQTVQLQRDGLAAQHPARLGLVALDEGIGEDEQMPAALRDRMAFSLVLDSAATDEDGPDWSAPEVLAARALLPQVALDDEGLQALCAAAQALGIDSLRAPLLAARAARAAAALAGSDTVEEEHIAVAARLVLAPRATRLPPPSADDTAADDAPEDAPADAPDDAAAPEPAPPDSQAKPPPEPEATEQPPADPTAPPEAPTDDDAVTRIETMVRTNDGFEIADVDLQLRGPGDLMGTRQSGVMEYKLANLVHDGPLVEWARRAAARIVDEDSQLEQPEHAALRARFSDYARGRMVWGRIA